MSGIDLSSSSLPSKEDSKKVLQFLKQEFKKGYCYECLSEILDIKPVDQVKKIIGSHFANGQISYRETQCQKCGIEKGCYFYQYFVI
jgi:hypothetical protein